MPDEIYGVMAVKNGQKQTIMNLSNARQKSYADLQNMTDAQKKGVIVCPDYPKEEFLVTADEVSYGSGTVKDALDGLTSNNMGNSVLVTAGTAYTTPSNGYIQIYVKANSEIDLNVLSSDNNNGVRFDVINTASSGIYQFTYVTKGLRILWSASTANNGAVSFSPLV